MPLAPAPGEELDFGAEDVLGVAEGLDFGAEDVLGAAEGLDFGAEDVLGAAAGELLVDFDEPPQPATTRPTATASTASHGLALLLSLLDRANLVTSCVVRGGRCRSLTVIRMRSREGSRREASSRARLPLTACRLAMAFDSRRSRRWPSRYQTITRALCPI